MQNTRDLWRPQPAYVVEYPEAIELLNKQMSIFWFPDEINVEKDVQDILVNLTPAERHGVTTTLKLFTQYELIVGTEYWQRVGTMFQKPADIQRMANAFSFFELNVHAPFYSKINEALGLANEKFYTDYVNDPVLKQRIESLERYANSDLWADFMVALAFAEGVILYSNFAFLKHFQSQGKNKILNIVRGINFSARDEGLHSLASAWLFRELKKEGNISDEQVYPIIEDLAIIVRDHEYQIVDKIFEQGPIDGITATQMKHFIDSRINLVARNLGFNNLYEVKYNPIADWFYKGINDYVMNDFFSGQGREYVRTWSEDELW